MYTYPWLCGDDTIRHEIDVEANLLDDVPKQRDDLQSQHILQINTRDNRYRARTYPFHAQINTSFCILPSWVDCKCYLIKKPSKSCFFFLISLFLLKAVTRCYQR